MPAPGHLLCAGHLSLGPYRDEKVRMIFLLRCTCFVDIGAHLTETTALLAGAIGRCASLASLSRHACSKGYCLILHPAGLFQKPGNPLLCCYFCCSICFQSRSASLQVERDMTLPHAIRTRDPCKHTFDFTKAHRQLAVQKLSTGRAYSQSIASDILHRQHYDMLAATQ